ncbi:hypothetical protein BD309DRAFT_959633 [Dichomitus squalens]|nr:hypothetical protein BD309DRAFT_959633 [Dichomitus squalens]
MVRPNGSGHDSRGANPRFWQNHVESSKRLWRIPPIAIRRTQFPPSLPNLAPIRRNAAVPMGNRIGDRIEGGSLGWSELAEESNPTIDTRYNRSLKRTPNPQL